MTRGYFRGHPLAVLAASPVLIAASAPAGQGLDTPTLLFVTTAIVGVVLLRGVLLRRHLRKRRPVRRRGDAEQGPATRSDDGDGNGGDTDRD